MRYQINLCCKEGPDKGRLWRYVLDASTTIVIGRLRGCHLLLHDTKVSQSHCLLQIQDDKLCLIDMGSHSCTYVNGQAISRAHTLADGDMISIGNSSLLLSVNAVTPKTAGASAASDKRHAHLPAQPPGGANMPEGLPAATMLTACSGTENKPDPLPAIVLPQLSGSGECSIGDSSTATLILPTAAGSTPQPKPAARCCQLCGHDSGLQQINGVRCCQACQTIAGIWESNLGEWQIDGEPWYSNRYGVVVPAANGQRRSLLYLSRQPHPQLRLTWLEQEDKYAHPHIYPVGQHRMCQEHCVAELPFCPGRFVDKLKTLPSALEAMELVLYVAKALEYGHTRWGAHGEICPHNMYQEISGRPYLLGYGLLRCPHFPEHAWSGEGHLDTLYFAAPEVIAGASPEATADEFSLAASLFALLTGSFVYQGETWEQIRQEALVFMPPRHRFRHPLLGNFFSMALARQPADRYPDIGHFTDAMALVVSACRNLKQDDL